MKKMMHLAVVALMSVLCAGFVGCSEDYSDMERVTPTPPPTPTPDPTPTPSDSTDSSWRWSTIVDQTVTFDQMTEIVEANNIAQLSKQSGETKLDSAQLRYQFGVQVSAPTRVVVMSPDTTAYAGKGIQKSEYGEFYRQGNDSLHTVTTTVEGGFKTSYYTLDLTTTRKEGYSLHAGKWLSYKNVTESSLLTSIWHEPLYEVEQNDSIFNRETVHNILTITLRSDKGKTWNISREKVVIVDHFKGMKEKEETIEADDYLKGLTRFVSCTKVYNTDTKLWGDAYLFEGAESYRIFVRWYTKDDTPKGTTSTEVSFSICPKSNDYNAVAYIKGGLYPGQISQTGKVWDIGCYINGSGEVQGYGDLDVDFSGIKNFTGNNTAYPSPYIAATPSTKTVNGVKVISVTGKTSVHTSMVTIADTLLKK